MNKADTSKLTAAQETLLIPLWARAQEARRADPILRDDKAASIIDSLQYDFGVFQRAKVDQVGLCSRAAIIDELARQHLAQHPRATVVEIGAGLDTRFDRLDNGAVRWIELDLPDVMSVRRSFFEETERRSFLAASVVDASWLTAVPADDSESLLLVAEGVFYFLARPQLQALFARLADHFPGARLIFDSISPVYRRIANFRHPLAGSRLIWSLRDVREIERWDARLRLELSVGFGDRPYYARQYSRFPRLYRFARAVYPPIRRMFLVNRLRLGR